VVVEAFLFVAFSSLLLIPFFLKEGGFLKVNFWEERAGVLLIFCFV
jgi:hypothetical protein